MNVYWLFRILLVLNTVVIVSFAQFFTNGQFLFKKFGFFYVIFMCIIFVTSFYFSGSFFFLLIIEGVLLAHCVIYGLIFASFLPGIVFALISSYALTFKVTVFFYLPSFLLLWGNVKLFQHFLKSFT